MDLLQFAIVKMPIKFVDLPSINSMVDLSIVMFRDLL